MPFSLGAFAGKIISLKMEPTKETLKENFERLIGLFDGIFWID